MSILKLSKYILFEILKFLNLKEICLVSITCKTFKRITESDYLWNAAPGSGDGSRLKHNFCVHSGIINSIHSKIYQLNILSGHLKQINAVRIKKNKVLTCSEDKSVHLWNLKQKKANRIIVHTDSVTSSEFCENGVVSISLDKTMKIWRKNKGVKTIKAHIDGVTQLNKINENRFITGSADGFIKIWDVAKGINLLSNHDFDEKINLIENNQQYYCFSYENKNDVWMRDFEKTDVLMHLRKRSLGDNSTGSIWYLENLYHRPIFLKIAFPLVYAAYFEDIKVWDLRCENEIENIPLNAFIYPPHICYNFAFNLILNGPTQLLVGLKTRKGILEYDLRTLEPIYHEVHNYELQTLNQGKSLFNDLLVSSGKASNFDMKLNVYKQNNLDSFTSFEIGHRKAITCVDISDNYIASGAFDGDLRVMKFLPDRKILKTQGKVVTIKSALNS